MNFEIKLFNYKGTPVYFKIWFLLLLLWIPPTFVLSIFISILLHEIGHAFMAKKYGYRVDNIQIGLLVGQANMNIDSIDDRHMISIVGAGPWVNLVLTSLSIFAYAVFPCQFFNSMYIVNLFLLIFNIIPIFPLDGGRILRSILILKTKDRSKSIRISACVSLILSIALLFYYMLSFSVVGIIFSLLFIAYSAKELGWVKL